jgi:hypothetical protein
VVDPVLIEVQSGDYPGEDDIYRGQDIFGLREPGSLVKETI